MQVTITSQSAKYLTPCSKLSVDALFWSNYIKNFSFCTLVKNDKTFPFANKFPC